MAQLMPNGFERFEIRFSRKQAELYVRMSIADVSSGRCYGGEAKDARDARDWSLGLLTMCLFDLVVGQYAIACESGGHLTVNLRDFKQVVQDLDALHLATLAVMCAELEEQVRLFRMLETCSLFAGKD